MNTAIDLAKALAAASAAGDGDVVVDLSKVQFMDAAIVTALVRGRNILRSRSRQLILRAPSGFAGRLLHLCGLAGSIDPLPADAVAREVISATMAASALDRLPSAERA